MRYGGRQGGVRDERGNLWDNTCLLLLHQM